MLDYFICTYWRRENKIGVIHCTEFITVEWQRLSVMRQITVFVTQAYLKRSRLLKELKPLLAADQL